MAIYATTTQQREVIPMGAYPARCFQMLHIGSIKETFEGQERILNKVRIGFELPTELRTFNADKGEQPMMIAKEFTLSLGEKSNLRTFLKNWRSKDFTQQEAEKFDISRLLGVPCMLNVIHKTSAKGVVYAEIGSVSPLPKGLECPAQINSSQELTYESFDFTLLNTLPDFLKERIQSSVEYQMLMSNMNEPMTDVDQEHEEAIDNDELPF